MNKKDDIVFFSWIGFKDLNYVDEKIKDAKFHDQLEKAKKTRPSVSQESLGYSPIICAFKKISSQVKPNKLVLFFDLDDKILGSKTLKRIELETGLAPEDCKIEYISVDTEIVHNSVELSREFFNSWNNVCNEFDHIKTKAYFNLCSGTDAMHAMFVFLGKSKFVNSFFVQFYNKKEDEKEPEVTAPFEINFDVGSYVLSNVFDSLENLPAFDSIIGNSIKIKAARDMATKASQTDFNVLLFGETGTGKELFARAIHESSSRKDKKFTVINCATLSPALAESDLFGYKKGAFTGATEDKKGIFHECDGGTLFLDEIEACPIEVQAKLLRALQPLRGEKITQRTFKRVGSVKDEKSDVRIIAATNKNLTTDEFRSDLLTRLAVLTITVPPLRERKEDLKLLIKDISKRLKDQMPNEFKDKRFSEESIKFIEGFSWPGNVRQLQNAIAQAIVFSNNNVVTLEELREILVSNEFKESSNLQLDEVEDVPSNIQEFLEESEYKLKAKCMHSALEKYAKKSQAAKALGISYQTFDNWRNELKKKGYWKDI